MVLNLINMIDPIAALEWFIWIGLIIGFLPQDLGRLS